MNVAYEDHFANDTLDVWLYHQDEPGYRRELPCVDVFRLYAFSPSTEKATYDFATPKDPEGVLKVHGPQKSLVWFSFRTPVTPQLHDDLTEILAFLNDQGKLKES